MKLNESNLIQEAIENVPLKDGITSINSIKEKLFFLFSVELTISTLGEQYVERLLSIIANALDNSRHLEYYLTWTQHLLTYHGPRIKPQQNMPALICLQKSLSRKYETLAKM